VEDNPNSKGIAVTQDEIIEMARQAGICIGTEDKSYKEGEIGYIFWGRHGVLEAFAKLVAEKEREACAKICDDHWEKGGAAYYCAKTIRYRG
jgi:hypothetical protein